MSQPGSVWLGRKVLLPRRGTVGRESLLDFLLLRTEDLFGSLGPGGAPSLPAFFRLFPFQPVTMTPSRGAIWRLPNLSFKPFESEIPKNQKNNRSRNQIKPPNQMFGGCGKSSQEHLMFGLIWTLEQRANYLPTFLD